MKWLLMEGYLMLGWARLLKAVPFSKITPSLGKQMQETSHALYPAELVVLRNISAAIHLASRYTFWESECLVKAIAGMKMLEKRNIASTLYLGTAKDNQGELIAHAWLRSGTYYVSGAEVKDKFTTVAMFAKE